MPPSKRAASPATKASPPAKAAAAKKTATPAKTETPPKKAAPAAKRAVSVKAAAQATITLKQIAAELAKSHEVSKKQTEAMLGDLSQSKEQNSPGQPRNSKRHL